MKADPIALFGHVGQKTGHEGRIDLGQMRATGRHDIPLGILQIGIGLNFVTDGHIDTPLLGVPAAGDEQLLEEDTAYLLGQLLVVSGGGPQA